MDYLEKQERKREFYRWVKVLENYLQLMDCENDLLILEARLFLIGKDPVEAGQIILAVRSACIVY